MDLRIGIFNKLINIPGVFIGRWHRPPTCSISSIGFYPFLRGWWSPTDRLVLQNWHQLILSYDQYRFRSDRLSVFCWTPLKYIVDVKYFGFYKMGVIYVLMFQMIIIYFKKYYNITSLFISTFSKLSHRWLSTKQLFKNLQIIVSIFFVYGHWHEV